jgi:uncharacterized protein
LLRVWIQLTRSGAIRAIRAQGHAGYAPSGSDIVCAAATALLRTAARTFERKAGIEVAGGAERRGEMTLDVISIADSVSEWATGASETVVHGLADIAAEFPDAVSVEIEQEEEKERHGS